MKLYKIKSSNEVTEIMVDENDKSEKSIEEIIELNPNLITGDKLFIIGRQVHTDSGKILDLLAVDRQGNLVVIELKKGYAPRDIVAQILDYSSWLSELSERRIEDIAKQYISATGIKYTNFHDAFKKYYSSSECPEIGGKNRVRNILMAKEFSDEVVTPAKYLTGYDLSIYCVAFEFFKKENENFISIKNIVGSFDTFYAQSTEVNSDRYNNRINVKKLITYLQDNFGKKYDDIRLEQNQDFSLYQGRDGEWTHSYKGWVYDDGAHVMIEIGIQSTLKEGIYYYATLSSHPKSKLLHDTLHTSEVKKILSDYKDESKNNKVEYNKFLSHAKSNQKTLIDFAKIEVPKLIDVVGTL